MEVYFLNGVYKMGVHSIKLNIAKLTNYSITTTYSGLKRTKMSFVISNCNYCRAKNIRLDNKGFNKLSAYQWDILAICSNCNYPTVYRLIQKTGIEFPFNEQLKVATKLEDLKNLNLNLFFSIGSIIVPPNR